LSELERFVSDIANWKVLLEFFPGKNIPEVTPCSADNHFGSVRGRMSIGLQTRVIERNTKH